MKWSLPAALVLWTLAVAPIAGEQLKIPLRSVHKNGWITSLGSYEPKTPKSLNDIAEPARSRLVQHLKDRLGEAFYSSLILSGGQIVDFAEFHRVEPDWKDFKWEVFAYNLTFKFKLPEKGIEYYEANIKLRSDGSIIEEIDLPDMVKHPERSVFVSLSGAMKTATTNGFNTPRCKVDLLYLGKDERCVYAFREIARQDGSNLDFKCIDIDAHTGIKLRIFNRTGYTIGKNVYLDEAKEHEIEQNDKPIIPFP